MSEYQYYEFQALDRPLRESEMEALRARSGRASITPGSFVNHYDWGDLKADPADWMARYFDAFVYVANWGSRRLMLRFPLRVLDLEAVATYCPGGPAGARAVGESLILDFLSEEEAPDDWDDGSGWMRQFVALRGEIAEGDRRALYLAWLRAVQEGEVEETASEPPVPPGLGALSAPLESLVDFLKVDADLVAAAAQASGVRDEAAFDRGLREWIGGLPEAEKTALLVRCATGDTPQLHAELRRGFLRARPAVATADAAGGRSVAELLAAAERLAAERRRREAERAAREEARRAREAAARREAELDALARRQGEAWREVEALIAARQPRAYDEAVGLLRDLLDLAAREGSAATVEAKIAEICARQARKPSFLARLRAAGLAPTGA